MLKKVAKNCGVRIKAVRRLLSNQIGEAPFDDRRLCHFDLAFIRVIESARVVGAAVPDINECPHPRCKDVAVSDAKHARHFTSVFGFHEVKQERQLA